MRTGTERMMAIIVIDGNGEPKFLFDSTNTVSNPAFDEAYDLLKRGVLGHFQFVPVDRGAFQMLDETISEQIS
jgi:hypothetical protein